MQNIKIEPFKVVGITVRTTNQDQKAAQDIPGLWNKFMSENLRNSITNRIDDTIYCMYTDYKSDHTESYTTLIGCKVDHLDVIPTGMVGMAVDGGTYKKMTVTGDLEKGIVINKWFEIWEMDLERVYTVDFEIYDHKKAKNPTAAEVDFMIAIE